MTATYGINTNLMMLYAGPTLAKVVAVASTDQKVDIDLQRMLLGRSESNAKLAVESEKRVRCDGRVWVERTALVVGTATAAAAR